MTTPRTTSSVRVDERNSRPAWLTWLLGLLLLALLALLLCFFLGDDDEGEADVDTPAVSQEAGSDVEPDVDAEVDAEPAVPEDSTTSRWT